MAISDEITRITNNRNTIRNKLVTLGLATSSDNLDTIATAVNGIVNRGSPSAQVTEGNAYTIQPGYYSGGSVQGVSGGGNYNLQAKTVTPTKSQIAVAPDSGYYGLSGVTVNPIPAAYQDVSSVTATASDVLATKTFVPPNGTLTAGTMPNNGSVSKTLDANTGNQSYTVPLGYHNGSGTVQIVLENKTATPSENVQEITPTTGKVLSKVTVNAIPSDYVDVSDADGVSGDVVSGKVVYSYDADAPVKITGTMPDNGTVTKTLDATTGNQSYTIPAGKHSGSGSVGIVLETKTATPTKSVQTVVPTTGKVLSSVSIGAIPDKYQDISGVTAVAGVVLDGYVFVGADGEVTEGTMTDLGAISGTITGLGGMTYTIQPGYTSGGTVTLTDDIENVLAGI